MTKHQLNLTQAERTVVLYALKCWKQFLIQSGSQANASLIEIPLVKVKESASPMLDGMEMNIIVQALRRRANFLKKLTGDAEWNIHLKLADRIDEERQAFQYRFGPRIA